LTSNGLPGRVSVTINFVLPRSAAAAAGSSAPVPSCRWMLWQNCPPCASPVV